jgi:AraC-like DNA-binding protein
MGIMGSHAGNDGADSKAIVRSRFLAPPAVFDGCFTTFYRLELDVDGDGVASDYLQPEWANIRFFSGAMPWCQIEGGPAVEGSNFTATGPSSHPAKFTLGTSRMWGVGFLPLGWARFFDDDASSVANLVADGHRHPAFSKFSHFARELRQLEGDEQAQVDLLADGLSSLMRPNRDEERIVCVHQCLLDTKLTNVADFAEEAGVSTRTLERLCRRYFGFPPKLLLRRQRFMRSLASFFQQRDGNWTDAMDEHYHDQAQFTREFQQFMRMKPTEYAAMDHPILSSFMEMRRRVWGSPVQTLDSPS